jgi:hypothetical protein
MTATTQRAGWRADLAAAAPGWFAARAAIGIAWLVNAAVVAVRFDGGEPQTTAHGLFAWDGAYYRAIAELGYAGAPADGIRFHPLLPVLGVDGTGVLLLANLGALLAGALVHRLVLEVQGDADLARRSATLVALVPPAFTLVWAYAEGPFIALSAAQLLLLHRRRWWAAGALGALAALARPAGAFLAVPAAVEALRDGRARRLGTAEVAARGAAVLGPLAGFAGFLLWVERATGDWAAPLRVQDDFRDGFRFLPLRLAEGIGEVVTDPLGDGLHVPFALAILALAWVSVRRQPAAWAALAVVGVLTSLSAGNLNSIERYALGTVPLVVALAAVAGGRWWRPTVALSTAGMVGMAVLAWQGDLVP